MYEIKKKQKVLSDGTKITTYSRELESFAMMEIEAGTTGYKGGDSGHGGRTYFSIRDMGGTDISPKIIKSKDHEDIGIEITLGGDSELSSVIEALKFITQVLEEESNGRKN